MVRRLKVLTVVLIIGGVIAAVALAASSPSVVTGPTSNIADNSVVLHGTVNPNGTTTSYQFEWGLTTAYGVLGAPKSAGGGIKSLVIHETAAGLIPGTLYHYRLLAANKFGTTVGADRRFKTAGHPPPGATTGPAVGISASGATVTGVINPNGQTTTWTIQWGVTPFYGSQTFGGTVQAGSAPAIVASTLLGLQSGTIFHYRIIAQHTNSPTSFGTDAIFMTFPSPRPTPGITARTAPHHAHTRPFVFTTTGSLHLPASIPAGFGCTSGQVALRFWLGRKQVAFAVPSIQPTTCAFLAQTVFRGLPGHGPRHRQVHLHITVHFRGNNYQAPADARIEQIVLG
jgi:hypothetical protein